MVKRSFWSVLCSSRVLHPFRVGWLLLLAALLYPAPGWAAGKLKVTTTVSMVTDLVRQVGGDRVEVTGLMGAGVDPHLYKATASDVTRLQKADVIFYCGLMLEGKMEEIFTRLARSKKQVHAVASAVPEAQLLKPPGFEGHPDPHIWFDVSLWEKALGVVVDGLAGADAPNAGYYRERGAAAAVRMRALHAWALAKAAELPEERRILVTSHDAYNYFGRAYGFKVIGLQGVSTVTEAGLADVTNLIDFIRKNKVKAIFVESSVPHVTIGRISKEAGVRVGGELFSDAMGTPGQMENGYDLGTYDGMIRHNLTTIIEGLK